MDTITSLMKKFNFTEYETKVYITLLKIGQATGYEISKMSNVPRSKVYNVLETLSQKGAVSKSSGQTTLYCAVSVDDLIYALRQEKQKDLDILENELQKEEKKVVESNEIWNVEGYDAILAKVKKRVLRAQNSLFLQIWKEDLDEELIEYLLEAEKRVKKYVLILFSQDQDYDIGLHRYYRHYFEHEKLEEMRYRWLNVVQDDQSMVLATIFSQDQATAVSTSYGPMVLLAKEYVKHDAYTARILELMDEQSLERLGPDKVKVRDIY